MPMKRNQQARGGRGTNQHSVKGAPRQGNTKNASRSTEMARVVASSSASSRQRGSNYDAARSVQGDVALMETGLKSMIRDGDFGDSVSSVDIETMSFRDQTVVEVRVGVSDSNANSAEVLGATDRIQEFCDTFSEPHNEATAMSDSKFLLRTVTEQPELSAA